MYNPKQTNKTIACPIDLSKDTSAGTEEVAKLWYSSSGGLEAAAWHGPSSGRTPLLHGTALHPP